MNPDNKKEEFYIKLRQQLIETSLWPSIYLYKFIVRSDREKIIQIEDHFNNMGAVITKVQSKKGNFTSVSVNVKMKNPDTVIAKYREIERNIEGVISL
jgi:putative lipoic acid-binding regulatory protein